MKSMRTLALCLLVSTLFLPSGAYANERAWGYCQNGNQVVITGGVSSTTKVQGSFPGCTITVFESDGVTLATLYSDNLLSPTPKSNPFTADSTGFWFFYAANNAYRVQMSGGGIPSPVLIGDILLFDPGVTATNPINSGDYNFSPILPSGTISVGSNTVTLSICPKGVSGNNIVSNNKPHLLYIDGTGTPESVAITGGGCTGTGTSGGTIQFTAAFSHSAGFRINSNTTGIQEAIYYAGTNGSVIIPGGIINLWGNTSSIAALTIPSGYNTYLKGSGKFATNILTKGTVNDWIRFECAAPCSQGSGGAGSISDLSIYDSVSTNHSSGAMIRIRYRGDFYLNNVYANNTYDGIVAEGLVRFMHSHFTVGTSHFGYEITCKGPTGAQVDFPTCLSYGQVVAPFVSSATSGTHAIHIEAPTAGIQVVGPNLGAASNTSNVAFYTTAVGINPWNEVTVGGACIIDGHSVGFEAIGNGSSYTSNSIQVDNCRITSATNAVFAASFVSGLSITNSVLTAFTSGTVAENAIQLNGDVQHTVISNNPQINAGGAACLQTAGSTVDLTLNNNVCGMLAASAVQPTSALSLGGTITGFNVKDNILSGSAAGAVGIVASTATITGLNWANNTGSVGFPFSNFNACAAALQGQTAPISDSTTAVWGATITGGGANKVMGYCNGTAWTVSAK